jgi:hypothetical protein
MAVEDCLNDVGGEQGQPQQPVDEAAGRIPQSHPPNGDLESERAKSSASKSPSGDCMRDYKVF